MFCKDAETRVLRSETRCDFYVRIQRQLRRPSPLAISDAACKVRLDEPLNRYQGYYKHTPAHGRNGQAQPLPPERQLLRFYLKYSLKNRDRIKRESYELKSLGSLPEWSAMMGLQFENLVLNSRCQLHGDQAIADDAHRHDRRS